MAATTKGRPAEMAAVLASTSRVARLAGPIGWCTVLRMDPHAKPPPRWRACRPHQRRERTQLRENLVRGVLVATIRAGCGMHADTLGRRACCNRTQHATQFQQLDEHASTIFQEGLGTLLLGRLQVGVLAVPLGQREALQDNNDCAQSARTSHEQASSGGNACRLFFSGCDFLRFARVHAAEHSRQRTR